MAGQLQLKAEDSDRQTEQEREGEWERDKRDRTDNKCLWLALINSTNYV